ncbi:Protein of unknown function [Roseomonas rosea]|uniref:Glycosyltransferase 61 catalytic domain-containing protein n=1 Tax=Muricoccus roseus TaxID=198092 RepID=A0A1M6P9F3_9PROT|nr:glycosyltransferase family 61 protein [Roseomonas rosea]SHK04522.1 Protein of unknown function [Roseomonas rosea]
MAETDTLPLAQPPTEIDEGEGKVFRHAPRIFAERVPGAVRLGDAWAPGPLEGLADRVFCPDEASWADLVKAQPGFAAAGLPLPAASLLQLPAASLLHHARVEGFVFTEGPRFVRESRGSPRVNPDNDLVRNVGREWYLGTEHPFAGQLRRGVVCYDSASRNYAHFLMIFLPRIVFANRRVSDMPFIVPDLPSYAAGGAGIRNEMLYRLADILPLDRGNVYWHLPDGRWSFDEISVVAVGPDRWGLVFHPEVQACFTRISREALRRRDLLRGGGEGPRRIYVSRQGAQRRRVLNQEALDPVLARHGFVPVRLEALDFFEQAALFAGAEAVIGLHGAGLANILFNDGGATLFELYPEGEAQPHFANSALSRGCRYVPLRCRKMSKHRDVAIDPAAVEAALSRLPPPAA